MRKAGSVANTPPADAAKRREIVRRHLAALVHHGDHALIDAALTRAADWLAAHEPGELQVVLAPAPRVAPERHLVTWFGEDGWHTDGAGHEHTHPAQAWVAFRRAPVGAELVVVGAIVSRRVAVRGSRADVRFVDIDELALEGPAAREALAAWLVFAGPPPASSDPPAGSVAPGVGDGGAPLPDPVPLDYVEIIPASVTLPPPEPPSSQASEPPSWSSSSVLAAPPAPTARVSLPTAWPVATVAPEADEAVPDLFADMPDRRPWGALLDRPWQGWLAYGVIGAVAALLAFVFMRFTVDDAFITWRYGQTFVHSGHWNWNRSGPRVEAYSNFPYAVLSIVPTLLRIPVELFFKLVALAIVAGYAAVVHRLRLPRRQEALLLAALLVSPVFFLQVFGGLETASFALLIAVLFGRLHRSGELDRLGILAAAGVALSRPEGIVFAVTALAWAVAIRPSRRHLTGLLGVAGGWAVYWLWRWQHFGRFFPNPYYEKAAGQGSLAHRFAETLGGLAPSLALAGLGAVVVLVFRRRDPHAVRFDRATRLTDATPLVLAVLSAVVILGLYKHSNLVMDQGHRFTWQLLVPIVLVVLCRPFGGELGELSRVAPGLLALGMGAATAVAWQSPDAASSNVAVGLGALVVFGGIVGGLLWRWDAAPLVAAVGLAVAIGHLPMREATTWLAYRYRLQHAHEAMATALANAHLRGGVVMFDAGILPYALPNQVIDIGGLANAQVTQRPLTDRDFSGADVQVVILGFGSPALSLQFFGGPGASAAYHYATTHQMWSAAGVEFGPGYYLNYFVSPQVATSGLPQRLAPLLVESQRENDRSDREIVAAHLWDFPFL
jgi:hypothetical protein